MSSSAMDSAWWRAAWPTGLRGSKNSASCSGETVFVNGVCFHTTELTLSYKRKNTFELYMKEQLGILQTSALLAAPTASPAPCTGLLHCPLILQRTWCSAPLTRRRYCPTLKCRVGWPSLQGAGQGRHGVL